MNIIHIITMIVFKKHNSTTPDGIILFQRSRIVYFNIY